MCMSFGAVSVIQLYGRAGCQPGSLVHNRAVGNMRWVEEKRPGQYMPIYQDGEGSYILNSKDIVWYATFRSFSGQGSPV